MAKQVTKLEHLINPEVMADMINAKIEEQLNALPFAKVDTTLQGQAGDTITIPKWGYIGEAVDVEEGEEIPTTLMSVTSENYTIKMVGIGGIITDRALLSAHGNPQGMLTSQIGTSLRQKTNTDIIEALYGTKIFYTGTDILGYNEVVKAIDVFNEEFNSQKAMWVHPKQVTQLRLDPDFISKEKYGNEVMVNGEIGMIANVRIIPSKKVKLVAYQLDDSEGTITIVADDVTENGTQKHLSTIMKEFVGALKVGDKVKAVTTKYYVNPIVKLNNDTETEDDESALTIFLKRDANIEVERRSSYRQTEVTGDKCYVACVTNESRVLLAKLNEVAKV